MKSFIYLATPYRAFPSGKQAAFEAAAEQATLFLKADIPVFCPITHSHPIAVAGKFKDIEENAVFLRNDEYFMRAAEALVVCELPGWDVSKGVEYEIWKFKTLNKHIIHMTPGIIPAFFKTSLKEKFKNIGWKALDHMCNGPI